MREIVVYPGDNGQQEFFEDADSDLAIMRNHGDRDRLKETEYKDRGWWVHGNGSGFPAWFEDKEAEKKPGVHTGIQGTAQEVIEKLEKQYEIKVTIDRTKTWVDRKGKSMKLMDSPSV